MPLRELPALTPVPARQITSGCLSGPLSGQSQIKLLEKFLYRNAVMPGNALQNAGQSLGPDRIVQWNHFMMLSALLRRDTHMRATLAHWLVTHPAKRCQQNSTADIAWNFHATRTSSRTKCRRIRFGRSMVSSK